MLPIENGNLIKTGRVVVAVIKNHKNVGTLQPIE